jgi:hypothetical protein
MSRVDALQEWFIQPFADALRAMDRSLGSRLALPLMLLAMFASWWLYVPLHELFHAWGCLVAGGTVSKLEIDTVYGAAWLAGYFPYIVPGSEYAGRLSGFDTGGSDAVYLITVLFPYLLTLFPGIPALYLAARNGSALLFGATLPWAYTPFLSLTGDYYEIGSILVSRLASLWWPPAIERWRSDDLPLLVETLFGATGSGSAGDAAGIAASLILGALGAWLTYDLGARLARRLVQSRDGR